MAHCAICGVRVNDDQFNFFPIRCLFIWFDDRFMTFDGVYIYIVNFDCDRLFFMFFFCFIFRWISLCVNCWHYFLHRFSAPIYTHPKWPQTFVMHSDSHWACTLDTFVLDNRLSILSVCRPFATLLFAHKIHKLCNGSYDACRCQLSQLFNRIYLWRFFAIVFFFIF